jgi:hypothetical protein
VVSHWSRRRAAHVRNLLLQNSGPAAHPPPQHTPPFTLFFQPSRPSVSASDPLSLFFSPCSPCSFFSVSASFSSSPSFSSFSSFFYERLQQQQQQRQQRRQRQRQRRAAEEEDGVCRHGGGGGGGGSPSLVDALGDEALRLVALQLPRWRDVVSFRQASSASRRACSAPGFVMDWLLLYRGAADALELACRVGIGAGSPLSASDLLRAVAAQRAWRAAELLARRASAKRHWMQLAGKVKALEWTEAADPRAEATAEGRAHADDLLRALVSACLAGQAGAARLLLTTQPDLLRADAGDGLALVAACAGGHEELARELLLWPEHAPRADCLRGDALFAACAGGHAEVAAMLLGWPQHAPAADTLDGRALVEAVGAGSAPLASALLALAPPQRAPRADSCDGQALRVACAAGDAALVGVLLRAWPAGGRDDLHLAKALVAACRNKHEAIAHALLDAWQPTQPPAPASPLRSANAAALLDAALREAQRAGFAEVERRLMLHWVDA